MLKQMMAVQDDQQTASTPDLWAATFAESAVMTPRARRRMRRSIEWKLVRRHITQGASILDAGCGFGEWVDVLADDGYETTGLDYSADLIARLREAYPHRTWIEGDIREIPAPDGSFDAVVSWGVIEHDEDGPGAALREFSRIVRPDGIIIVTVPLDSESQKRSSELLFPQGPRMAFFQYAMETRELEEFCSAAGFEPVQSGTIPGATFAMMAPRLCVWARGKGLFGRLLERSGGIVASLFPRYHLMTYVVARKKAEGMTREMRG